MGSRIRDVYIIHHSHTDIGYTDLQEQVIYNQVNNIRNVVSIIKRGYETGSQEKDFKWNCETYFCVEQYLESASEEEKADFFDLVRKGNIGISATYLNGTDLTDVEMLNRKTAKMQETFTAQGHPVKVAMNADINGISLGARDVFLKNGVEFLFTNIHTHHGMYPLYQNQTAYFWENAAGQRLLVWNGEHYNLGNALGIVPNKNVNFMMESYFGKGLCDDALENLRRNLTDSAAEYEASGYPYDFYITSVSGVFSDNAPVNPTVAIIAERFNERYGDEFTLHMVTLDELYGLIRDKVAGAPVYRGAINDWWGNGVGSTPYSVKHYKEALRIAHGCERLEAKTGVSDAALREATDANALLYAEHTWGHSATATDPCDTLVTDLDIRKTSYASKAHEAASLRRARQQHLLGDILRYYATSGRVKVVSLRGAGAVLPVEFYVETLSLPAVRVTDTATGEVLPVQLSSHPRGVRVSFLAHFAAGEEKIFSYEEQPAPPQRLYTRTAWVGSDRVRDIVNDYDSESFRLPYALENEWFRIEYRVGEGFTSFFCKSEGRELMRPGLDRFFTPIYENTVIRSDAYQERSILGRNVRGLHAARHQGVLQGVEVTDHGEIFDRVRFTFSLEGMRRAALILKMYRSLPRVEFTLQLAKTLSDDIESIYLPLSLDLPAGECWIHNGKAAMRPGVDQLPGSNMEYYIADEGLLYQFGGTGLLINTLDTPLLYMGRLEHHPIVLCDNKPENNARPVFSWVMNNTWETNFKTDLSGYGEFRYTLELHAAPLEDNLTRLAENDLETPSFIIG